MSEQKRKEALLAKKEVLSEEDKPKAGRPKGKLAVSAAPAVAPAVQKSKPGKGKPEEIEMGGEGDENMMEEPPTSEEPRSSRRSKGKVTVGGTCSKRAASYCLLRRFLTPLPRRPPPRLRSRPLPLHPPRRERLRGLHEPPYRTEPFVVTCACYAAETGLALL